MSDGRLDVFIESQRETNRIVSDALVKIADSVSDLEKHTVEVQNLAKTVNVNSSDIRELQKEVVSLNASMGFVKDAKRVFTALIIALVIGSATAVWNVVKSEGTLTKSDVEQIIKTLQASSN